MAFRNFNQDALDTYVQWVNDVHRVQLTLKEVPVLPPFASILAGSADAIAEDPKGVQWPVLVKKVWQSNYGEPKTIPDIINSRENFYVHKDKSTKKYYVLQNTAVYFMCQNILLTHGKESMDLILFTERNNDMLVVRVCADSQNYKTQSMFLKDFLHSKGF